MPRQINQSERDIAPGVYQFVIDTPTRSDSATFSLTRPVGSPWPSGRLFTYVVQERERGGQLVPISKGDEFGGPIPEVNGNSNYPSVRGFKWASDRDKDMLQIDVIVEQTFRTAVNIQFD